MSTPIPYKKIDAVIRKNIARFRKPGVLTVRPGYKMTGGWITDKPAIVVTVEQKKEGLTASGRLPSEVDDIAVDVRQASGMQCLRAWWPNDFTLASLHGRPENRDPDWPLERDVQTGKIIPPAPAPADQNAPAVSAAAAAALTPHVKETPKAAEARAVAPAKAVAADAVQKLATVKPKKQELGYTPAPKSPLVPFTGKMNILAYASPDNGFTVLQKFLQQAKTSLDIAMYDFTSGELLSTVQSTLATGKVAFRMVLDHPPRNPTAIQSDQDTHDDIIKADPAAKINWALTRNDPMVNEWVYPSAYHIKVVVRDNNQFWLSSGNFNVSNQPDLDSTNPKNGRLPHADRDWHVIVMQEEMAQLFAAYIDHDFSIAAGGQGAPAGDPVKHAAIKKALASQKKMKPKEAPQPPKKAFPFTAGKQKLFSGVQATVQPLLTPDPGKNTTMYVDNILALIQSAKKRVYMQTQYIHPSDKPADKDFMLLVQAMSDAVKKGIEVRLITSQFETGQWIEKLKPFGLDEVLRIQQRVHNKGIVIDSEVVLVSSQNWSADGTLRNRDAGLVISNPEIAAYFEAVFLEDWNNRAFKKA